MAALPTTEKTIPPGARPFSDYQSVRVEGNPYTAALDQARNARSGPGFLSAMTVANDTASKVTIKAYDSTTNSGTELATIIVPAGDTRNAVLNASFYNGVTFAIVGTASASVVVSASLGNP